MKEASPITATATTNDSISFGRSAQSGEASSLLQGDTLYLYQNQASTTDSIATTTSLFEGHLLQKQNEMEILQPSLGGNSIFICLLVAVFAYAWTLYFNYGKVWSLFSATWSNRNFNRLNKDGDAYDASFFPLLFLIISTFSLLIYKVADATKIKTVFENNDLIFASIFAGVGLVYTIKVLLIKFIAWITEEAAFASQYLLNLFTFNAVFALLMFPFVTISLFIPASWQSASLYFFGGFLIIWFTIRFFRNVFGGYRPIKFSYFHTFLYFCTLEMLYSFLLIKLIT